MPAPRRCRYRCRRLRALGAGLGRPPRLAATGRPRGVSWAGGGSPDVGGMQGAGAPWSAVGLPRLLVTRKVGSADGLSGVLGTH